MKKIVLSLLLSTFIMLGTGCTSQTDTTQTETSQSQKQTEKTVTLALIEDEKEISSSEVSVSEDQTVLEILKENFDVKEDGGFVTEIDGKEQDAKANKYWMYYINDKEADKGADSMTVSDKDVIEWRLNEFK